ncbi:hypothetical protein DSM106972_025430 [Dulcicalothrix desertica PCC 7102]|uniref:Uncharacterized protein n=1 Tax=Dulcicalothrix desertica PCC 7102 TaxID=232991 RepID=A0A433VML0_9CYAN|nr:hypothetical protein [Dulcicalothrix desertica]RUT07282.1 hypothetical protein DSM106972_025430 [Dulcicalothrix desertica PCC 7102]TWH55514.1 hypothetical protein CAL7102_03658 [Dulcicalothrix desertica PCC 7102]
MEQTKSNDIITIQDLMDFTLITLFPLKEPGITLKQIMTGWQKKRGTMMEYAKTKHYIFFDVDNACIRVLPLSFDGGFMPHERMMSAFPVGFTTQVQSMNDVDYTLFVDKHTGKKASLVFSYQGIHFLDTVFVGKQFNHSIAALTLSETINFLAHAKISEHYECVMLYPPT